jgi:hypothetical protein
MERPNVDFGFWIHCPFSYAIRENLPLQAPAMPVSAMPAVWAHGCHSDRTAVILIARLSF